MTDIMREVIERSGEGRPLMEYAVEVVCPAAHAARAAVGDEGIRHYVAGFEAGVTAVAKMTQYQERMGAEELAAFLAASYETGKELWG